MKKGNLARSVAATRMNEDSSRSHSVFTLKITQSDEETGNIIESKIQLVDLAGSEQVKRTGAAGERLEEAKSINLSLSCLGNVVSALVEKKPFVPYRDSKLTRLLQDSLGGTAKTSLVITLSPSSLDENESHSTLRFGQRAQNVQNIVTKNIRRTVDELERLLAKAEETIRKLTDGNPSTATSTSSLTIDEEDREEFLHRIEDLELALDKSKSQIESITNDYERVVKEKMKLDLQLSEANLKERRLQVDFDSLKFELDEMKKRYSSNSETIRKDSKRFEEDVSLLMEKCVKYQLEIAKLNDEIEFLKEAKKDQVWVVLKETQTKLKEAETVRDQTTSDLAICKMQLKNRQEHMDALQWSSAKMQKRLLTEIEMLEKRANEHKEDLKMYQQMMEGTRTIFNRPLTITSYENTAQNPSSPSSPILNFDFSSSPIASPP